MAVLLLVNSLGKRNLMDSKILDGQETPSMQEGLLSTLGHFPCPWMMTSVRAQINLPRLRHLREFSVVVRRRTAVV